MGEYAGAFDAGVAPGRDVADDGLRPKAGLVVAVTAAVAVGVASSLAIRVVGALFIVLCACRGSRRHHVVGHV